MAYIPNSFGAAIGVTDQQIIDAFSKNNPDLQANMQEYMRTYNRSNSDLLDMVKHYAPEAVLDLNQIMSYTQIPNQELARMFSAVPFAQPTVDQLSQFGQGLLAHKSQSGLLGSGVDIPTAQPPATSPPTYPHRPVTPNQQPGAGSPIMDWYNGTVQPQPQFPGTSLPTYPHRPVTPNQQPGGAQPGRLAMAAQKKRDIFGV